MVFTSNIVRVPHRVVVPAVLLVGGLLAVTSLVGDSITFDETSHLTAGMANWPMRWMVPTMKLTVPKNQRL